MNLLARILSHGFALVVVVLLGITLMYRGDLFPEWKLPEFLVVKDESHGIADAATDTADHAAQETAAAEDAVATSAPPAIAPPAIPSPVTPSLDVQQEALTQAASSPDEVVEVTEVTEATVDSVASPAVVTEVSAAAADPGQAESGVTDTAATPEAAPDTVPDTVPDAGSVTESVSVTETTSVTETVVVTVEDVPDEVAAVDVTDQAATTDTSDSTATDETEPPAVEAEMPAAAAAQAAVPQPVPTTPPADAAAGSAYALLAAAREAYWLRDYEQAEASYRQLIQLEPDNPDGYGELGNMYFARGQWQQAAAAYYEAGVRLVKDGMVVQARQILEVIRGLKGEQAGELEQLINNSQPATPATVQ